MYSIIFFLILSTNGFIFSDKENIILVPSAAFRNHLNVVSTDWLLYNQGWYYEEDSIPAVIMEKSLEKIIKKDLDINRIKLFTAHGKEKKNVCIDGLNRSMCTSTDDEGRIKNTFQITNNEMNRFVRTDINTAKVLFQISVPNKNIRITGEIYLCDDDGITFISDIDDTIKITGVTSSTDTLINTFSGDFKSVSGMSDIYQYWQKKYNATFAYLTASPNQLYPFLREFLDRENFPSGSSHMRHFTWFDENFISFFMSNNYIKSKTETIQMFIDNTFNRTFILLGDIFQKDPDIYASIYMKYPNRIGKIFVRKYNNDTSGLQRLQQVFKDIPQRKWSTFESGSDLPKDIFLV
ncbi:unnamed protein product [Adineta steineri]|uniref:Phosphatidate phosphatase APP1 catalytic domain-containing protein n=1 Tax=Adineta steineri TaxID=433720 RepID=A0A814XA27_9BILA|nr:unnamed protein product [Adineta steineri]CAF1215071.1 unnamed protein product [Adineta steineri]CAF3766422.1 unnamed protein product [Adineta steineri]CAF3823891.1 unnamed protein product [Adineta steineri]